MPVLTEFLRQAAPRCALAAAAVLAMAASPPPGFPRLAAVVAGEGSASAVFSDDAHETSQLVEVGDRVGAYTVETIAPGRVVLRGPDGELELSIAMTAAAPAQAASALSPQEQAVARGRALAIAARRFDECVAAGLIQAPIRPATQQITLMMAGAARGRRGQGDPGNTELAAALSRGVLQGQGAPPGPPPAADTCQAAETAWREAAVASGIAAGRAGR